MVDPLVSLTAVAVFGIGAQWLAWRLHLPSILLLLLAGIVAGPITGVVDPDRLLGTDAERLLMPFVSLSVAVILFEGGMSLKLEELAGVGRVVRRLVSLGLLVTWGVAAAGAWALLGFEPWLAVLLGALLTVTGPTVVLPLLRQVRPSGAAGSILKWEGIVIDPVGATVAVLVFETLEPSHGGAVQSTTTFALMGLLRSALFGTAAGVLGAFLLVNVLKRYWVPDFLHSAVTLLLVFASFTAASELQSESGLLAVTLMGILVANQKSVDVRHIFEFKENLRVLLIAVLFVLLAARVEREDVRHLNFSALAYIGLLILVARPLSVLASTFGSRLSWRERIFLMWMAPRGVVAAAVASVFALRLSEYGYTQAEAIAPITFLVIIGTVAAYGLTAGPAARLLGIAQPRPQGVLFAGAPPWACEIARVLKEHGIRVVLADTNRLHIAGARLAGLEAYHGSVLAEEALEKLDLGGIGRLLAVTSNDEVNTLAVLHFLDLFGRSESYRLSSEDPEAGGASAGRILFAEGITYEEMERRFREGHRIHASRLGEEVDLEALQAMDPDRSLPLFQIDDGKLAVAAADRPLSPRHGAIWIRLAAPEAESLPLVSERTAAEPKAPEAGTDAPEAPAADGP